MKIGIFDADLLDNGTRHPNLALMKISAYYKELGNEVELIQTYDEDLSEYEKFFISKVFSFTKVPDKILKLKNLIKGGTGFFGINAPNLPDEIEHHKPDYQLYTDYVNSKIENGEKRVKYADYLDYSIGFTTRGCFRKCDFCVNKKYDRPFLHSPVSEFLDENRPYIYLWDDNFLAYSGWKGILDELKKTNKPFQFRQGLDIRLMTDDKAKALSSVKYHGDYIFAFDHIEDKELIIRKLKLWRRYTNKTTKLYVLCAYNSQDEKDIENTFERIHILMKYGCLPYIMRYEDYNNSQFKTLYIQIARWCNQPQFFKKKSFRQFCQANQDYHKNKKTICSAYQCMLDFENNFPEIAGKYFDLRYEDENIYLESYGYGRKYANKKDCYACSLEQKTWLDAYNKHIEKNELLKLYFSKEIDLQCLEYGDSECAVITKDAISEWFIDILLEIDSNELFSIVNTITEHEEILPYNIPQFSKINDILNVCKICNSTDGIISFNDMGYYLNGIDRNDTAAKKYGENHAKCATLLDLNVINSINNTYYIKNSILGNRFDKLSNTEKQNLLKKLIFRIPVVTQIIVDATSKQVEITDYLHLLSSTTIKRRKSNVFELIKLAVKDLENGNDILKNIIY